MLDVSYVDAPLFVPLRGFEGHLFLGLGRAFGLVPSVESTIFGHDAATSTGRYLYPFLEKRGIYVDTF
jgi:hypothetical protein